MFRFFTLIVAVVFAAYGFQAWLMFSQLPFHVAAEMDIESLKRGALFGNAFGFIEALFSTLAFLGVVYGLGLQRKQLEQANEVPIVSPVGAQMDIARAVEDQSRVLALLARVQLQKLRSGVETPLESGSDSATSSLEEVAKELARY